jgi:hypothetical protein
MKITVNKCVECNLLFENDAEYKKHINIDADLKDFEKRWPEVKDTGCKFANGGWSVKRSAEWLENYKNDVVKLIRKYHRMSATEYKHWSYGFFRCLDDGGSRFYGISCRTLCICPKCFKEWGQPYYANECCKTKGDSNE